MCECLFFVVTGMQRECSVSSTTHAIYLSQQPESKCAKRRVLVSIVVIDYPCVHVFFKSAHWNNMYWSCHSHIHNIVCAFEALVSNSSAETAMLLTDVAPHQMQSSLHLLRLRVRHSSPQSTIHVNVASHTRLDPFEWNASHVTVWKLTLELAATS